MVLFYYYNIEYHIEVDVSVYFVDSDWLVASFLIGLLTGGSSPRQMLQN